MKRLGYSVKLDTNGAFPDRLRELAEKGLVDYVAMDVKTVKNVTRKPSAVKLIFKRYAVP